MHPLIFLLRGVLERLGQIGVISMVNAPMVEICVMDAAVVVHHLIMLFSIGGDQTEGKPLLAIADGIVDFIHTTCNDCVWYRLRSLHKNKPY